MCMFCRSLFVLLYFSFWPLCCLSFDMVKLLLKTSIIISSIYFCGGDDVSQVINISYDNEFLFIQITIKLTLLSWTTWILSFFMKNVCRYFSRTLKDFKSTPSGKKTNAKRNAMVIGTRWTGIHWTDRTTDEDRSCCNFLSLSEPIITPTFNTIHICSIITCRLCKCSL
jgi:hypothetical protein